MVAVGDSYWARTYGSAEKESACVVLANEEGGFIVAGTKISAATGKEDVWLMKLNERGNIEWKRSYGSNDEDISNEIIEVQQDSGGYIIVGTTTHLTQGGTDAFIMKVNLAGDFMWATKIGGPGEDIANSVIRTEEQEPNYIGNYYIVLGTTTSFGGTGKDILVVKLDQNGNMCDKCWGYGYDGTDVDTAYSITQSGNGYIIAGTTNSFGAGGNDAFVLDLKRDGTIAKDGIVPRIRGFGQTGFDGARSIQRTAEGGYIITGETTSFGVQERDLWVLKLDESLNVQWGKTIGYALEEIGLSIQQTTDGGYVIAGAYGCLWGLKNCDAMLVKIDQTGNPSWIKVYYGQEWDELDSVKEVIAAGQPAYSMGYIAAGKTESFGAGGSDVFLLRTNIHGHILTSACDFIYDMPRISENAYPSVVYAQMNRMFPPSAFKVIAFTFDEVSFLPEQGELCACAVNINNVEPTFGCAAGNEEILINGSDFNVDTQVYFDNRPSPFVEFQGTEQLKATTPAYYPGFFDVTVINTCGENGIDVIDTLKCPLNPGCSDSACSCFQYTGIPIIESIEPKAVNNESSNSVTIKGKDFSPSAIVTFRAEVNDTTYEIPGSITSITCDSLLNCEIKVNTPLNFPVSVADVCVINGECGRNCLNEAIAFYKLPSGFPFTPHIGTVAGGTPVRIYGPPQIIDRVSKVYFNSLEAVKISQGDGELIVSSPTHSEKYPVYITLCGSQLDEQPCIILPEPYEYSVFGFVAGKKNRLEIIDTTLDALADINPYSPGVQSAIEFGGYVMASTFSKNHLMPPGRYAYIAVNEQVGFRVVKLDTGTLQPIEDYFLYTGPEPASLRDIAIAEYFHYPEYPEGKYDLVVAVNQAGIEWYGGEVLILNPETMTERQRFPIPGLSLGEVVNITADKDKVYVSSLKGNPFMQEQILVVLSYHAFIDEWMTDCIIDGENGIMPPVTHLLSNLGLDSFYDPNLGKDRICIVAPEYNFASGEFGSIMCGFAKEEESGIPPTEHCISFDKIIPVDYLHDMPYPQDVSVGLIDNDCKAFVVNSYKHEWNRIEGICNTPDFELPGKITQGLNPVAIEIRSSNDKAYIVNENSIDEPEPSVSNADITVINAKINKFAKKITEISPDFHPRSIAIQTVIESSYFFNSMKAEVELLQDSDLINPSKKQVLQNRLNVIENLMDTPANNQAIISNAEAFKNQVENFVINETAREELVRLTEGFISSIE